MYSMLLTVKDTRGEPFEARVDMIRRSNGLQWTAALWANGYPAHIVSGDAKRCADIARTLQEAIIFSDLRVPTELVT
ncbi:hypothetical protein DyAD56_21255 [Dyella sp. AD56]|nr:hypothetical protein DyAD56_21255 [Dyella sp. AD56]ULU23423.1 hypothetical protein DYST_00319 [Dyella terrae]